MDNCQQNTVDARDKCKENYCECGSRILRGYDGKCPVCRGREFRRKGFPPAQVVEVTDEPGVFGI